MSSQSPSNRRSGGSIKKSIPTFSQYAVGSRSYNDLATRLQTAYVQRGGVTLNVTEIESFLFEAGIPNVDTSLLMSFVLTVRRGILRGERDGGQGGAAKEEVGRLRPRPAMTSATSKTSASGTITTTTTTQQLDPIVFATTSSRPIHDAMDIISLVDDLAASEGQSLLSSGMQGGHNNSPMADLSILPAGGLKRRKSITQLKNIGGGDVQGGGFVEGGVVPKPSNPTTAHLYMAMFIRETSSSTPTVPSSSSPVGRGGVASRERSASGIHRQSSRSGVRALPPIRQGGGVPTTGAGGDVFMSSVGGRKVPTGTFPTRLSPQDRLDTMKKIQNTFRCHLDTHPSRTAAIPITARSTTVPLPMLIELGIICIVRGLKRATLASQADEAARVVWSACGMDESSLPAAAGKKLRSLSMVSQDSSTQSTSQVSRTQLPLSVLKEHIVSRFFSSPIPTIIEHGSTSELTENSIINNRRRSAAKHRAGSTNTLVGGNGSIAPNMALVASSSTSTAPPVHYYQSNLEDHEDNDNDPLRSTLSMMTPGQDPLHSGSGGGEQATLSTSIQWGDSNSALENQHVSSSSGIRRSNSKSLTSQCSGDLPSFAHFVGKHPQGDLTETATFVVPHSPTFGTGTPPRQPPSPLLANNFTIGAHARRSLSYETSTGGGASSAEPTLSFEDLRSLLAEAVDDSSLLIALVFNQGKGGGGGRRLSGGGSDSLMDGPSGIDISRSENLIERRQQLAKLLSVQHTGGGSGEGDGRPGSPQLSGGAAVVGGTGGGPLGHLPPAARNLAQQISSDLRSDLLSEDVDTQHKIALLLHGSLLHSTSSSANGGKGNSSGGVGGLPTFSIPQRKQSSSSGVTGATTTTASKWNKLFALAAGDGARQDTGTGVGTSSSGVSNSAVEYQQIQECEMMHMDVLEGMLGVGPLSTPKRIRAVIRALAAFGRALERGREKRKRQGGGGGGGHIHFAASMYHQTAVTPAHTTATSSPSAGVGVGSAPPSFSNIPSPVKNHFRSVLQATIATGTFLHHNNNLKQQQDMNMESMSMTLPLDGGDSQYSDLRRQFNYALQTHIAPYLKQTQPALISPQSPRGVGGRGAALSPRFSDDDCMSVDGGTMVGDGSRQYQHSTHHNGGSSSAGGLPSVISPVQDRLVKLQAQLDAVRNDKNALLLQDASSTMVGTEVPPFRAPSKAATFTGMKKKKPFKRRMVDKGVQTDLDPTAPSMVKS